VARERVRARYAAAAGKVAGELYLSQPGLGQVLGARVLAEFGDDPTRYCDARARRNYAGTSPITRASGRRHLVLARYARNRRLADAVHQWAFCALSASPGARAYYDELRGKKDPKPHGMSERASRTAATRGHRT
jgi:transposase